MYTAKNICYSWSGRNILSEVNLRLAPGMFTAVLGPNGAGKSTLLKIISREIKDHTGEITLNGRNLEDYSAQELALVRAVLPQSVQVNFPFTAQEIVQLGRLPHREPQKKSMALALEIMEATGIVHLAGRNYASLSGGEQQRVQLARVIAQIKGDPTKPRYLLLDEPTSSLDIAQQHTMLHIARELCGQQVGVLAILHDMNLAAQYADELLFLKNGKPVAQGSTTELMQEDILEKTFSHPVQVMCHGCSNRPYIMALPYHQPKQKYHNEPLINFRNHG